jgi:branched-subunit amino acid ABC-type transport system permease component
MGWGIVAGGIGALYGAAIAAVAVGFAHRGRRRRH